MIAAGVVLACLLVEDGPAVEVTLDPSHAGDATAVIDRCRQNVALVCKQLGLAAEDLGEPIRLHVYGTHEAKGLATGDVRAFSLETDRTHDGNDRADRVGLVLDDEQVSRPDGRAEALAILHRWLGPSVTPMLLDGAVAWFGSGRSREEARRIAAWIVRAGEATPFNGLRDPDAYRSRSHLIQEPLAAVAVGALWEWTGRDGLQAAWQGDGPDHDRWQDAYQQSLAALSKDYADELQQHREHRQLTIRRHGLRGFCFGHEGYRIHNGYLSRQAQRSLRRAAELGANTVSITPFGFYRNLQEPTIRWARVTQRAGTENDEAVMVVGARARALGLATMLKPHLWGHGGWCGEIEMQSAADWDRWFHEYGEFLAHHALLAELGGYDWLSIGCELVRTTRQHGDRWRALATRARRLFAGGITYSANWGEEARELSFADALDAVGVNHYDPLSIEDSPTPEQLIAGCRENLRGLSELARKHDRPILITELGFPAREGAWREPYRGNWRGDATPAAQEACYDALVAALREEVLEDVVGLYVWKWPTLEDWMDGRTDYWPASPAVEDQMRALFRNQFTGGATRSR